MCSTLVSFLRAMSAVGNACTTATGWFIGMVSIESNVRISKALQHHDEFLFEVPAGMHRMQFGASDFPVDVQFILTLHNSNLFEAIEGLHPVLHMNLTFARWPRMRLP